MKGHPSGPDGLPPPPPHYTADISKDAFPSRSAPGPVTGVAPGAPKGKAGLAIAAALLFPFGVPSVVCGHLALRRMAKGEVTIDMVDARVLAWFGLAMGYMMTAGYLFMGVVAAMTFLT
ncbi:hypothetical protein [Actinomadura sp. WMMB 499]|uniref:hypothetical protein n=1 Tax=Actinomadura sp. WMMB 499 TaxID=1219491 RepID=UPI0012480844|nr:hypothetical protein [Actinomadura sp. WMMB 499]QFG21791.1 hypothetical protein F7P10_12260 [Actinomadura sp. WMMB 499]